MEPISEERPEFDEDDLFNEDGNVKDTESVSSDSETEEADTPAPFQNNYNSKEKGVSIIEESVVVKPSFGVSFSLPTNNIRMGSSVPISIPHLSRWQNGTDLSQVKPAEGDTEKSKAVDKNIYYPATFVPPHQLSHVEDFQFSFNGDSPSFSIKRERLRVRNAILKSTGFLEPAAKLQNGFGIQDRNRVQVGGLSQALNQRDFVIGLEAGP
uniref:Uncharacterized protein n=1 Tax=Polytomella parva TaxID=51329 RepID=A0A6U0Z9V9_9CHLO|mmetsp:Transcript_7983/g.15525  ORF Transcript_7983/g.15525 Transcript_7983/m.15525 type:complete len:211 (+) Transcript_7983:331-963(+)|eukprot:CAMPEP_0175043720 /NCGR_PEP_ID=MMETSP0052_2-20121109/3364_1 /TAXON_ID=51329 ORGANISM="Polytomella parva, Strain SAG 63-3" /NCGR_SAMPLE_ID=MMETSP0052_2 /ASSEMBLY_ACC=CAM_ASM_000194 /LENGTH=210 /DNA_ID=CAMNT_0016306851 /DNA_START=265 /DNA_END=897 /DNA_ORIENTATION=+